MTAPTDTTSESTLFCARCAAELQPGTGTFYQITIEAIADPSPPVVTSESAEELRRRIEETLAELAGTSAQEAMDQVHRRLMLHLCGPCYRVWIEDPTG